MICGALLVDLHPHVEEAGDGSVRARLRAAWRHINEAPSLRALLLVEAVALVFSESAGPVEVAYAKATLHAGDRGYGLLLATWGAGAVLGSLVFARSLRRATGGDAECRHARGRTCLCRLRRWRRPSLLACLAAFIGGIGNGVETPSLISVVQRLTPQHLQGRMMGAVESLAALCLAIGLPLGGVLVALSSPRGAFLVLGLVTAVAGVALLRVAPRRLEPVATGEAPTSVVTGDVSMKSATAQTPVP